MEKIIGREMELSKLKDYYQSKKVSSLLFMVAAV